MSAKAQPVTAADRPFVISRTFAAPRQLVWKVWTECEHLVNWWGPKGFTVRSCRIDPRPGGRFHYCLASPDGQVIWGRFVFREIAEPQRLEFIVSFSDPAGGITRHPWNPSWPLETLSTVTFSEADAQTTVTVGWLPHAASEDERQAFKAGHDSMRHGWGGTFDQLGDYLATA